MSSKKLTAIILVGISICIVFTCAWYVLDTTDHFNLDQYTSTFTETAGNLVKKLDVAIEDVWSIDVTNQNKIMVLGVLFAILIGGIIILAIIDKQISQMTMKYEQN